jgi:xanthosine utilization system XapX-like protein
MVEDRIAEPRRCCSARSVESLLPALGSLLSSAPIYVAMLVGIVLALLKWREHPRASGLALAGFGVILATSIVGALVMTTLPHRMIEAGATTPEVGARMAMLGLARSFVSALGWGLLVGAIFIDRQKVSPRDCR